MFFFCDSSIFRLIPAFLQAPSRRRIRAVRTHCHRCLVKELRCRSRTWESELLGTAEGSHPMRSVRGTLVLFHSMIIFLFVVAKFAVSTNRERHVERSERPGKLFLCRANPSRHCSLVKTAVEQSNKKAIARTRAYFISNAIPVRMRWRLN